MEKNEIGEIAKRGLALVEDRALRDALSSAYDSPLGLEVVALASGVFDRLTSSDWPVETLCRFVSGWRAMHGTALFVCGLLIRLQQQAQKATDASHNGLYDAAAELGEIIGEDTGLGGGRPHNELFAIFADCLVGDNRWQLDRYRVPSCERFRQYVKEQRLEAPIEEGILTTAASENWNAGEYTFFNSRVRPWVLKLTSARAGRADYDIEKEVEYVAVHGGNTELGHFLHALRAWKAYCLATGALLDPAKARDSMERYFGAARPAFLALKELLRR